MEETPISSLGILRDGELLNIISEFNSCKDIMAFSQIDKRNNSIVKDNIRYILATFIQSRPEEEMTYWERKIIDLINDPSSTNEQIYRRFVNSCLERDIVEHPGYRPGPDYNTSQDYDFISDLITYPKFKEVEKKYDYLTSVFHYNPREASSIASHKLITIPYLQDVYDVYNRYRGTPNEFDFANTDEFLKYSTIKDINKFRYIHDNMNYQDLSSYNRLQNSNFLLGIVERSDIGPNSYDIVKRVIRLYNEIVVTDIDKANKFLYAFTLNPFKYKKLLSKEDSDEELIPWLGGKRRKNKGRKSIKRHKSVKVRKSTKRYKSIKVRKSIKRK